ncbi:MAG: Co2+/Mg2+ efflux protein ApaG [Pseudomonadota bacterium]
MYEAVTKDIRVAVEPHFMPNQSDPDQHQYLWAYHIEIVNLGEKTVQLKDRFWQISDANGEIQEVTGAGVVGEQPILQPGERFTYTSGCPLKTPSGFMVGKYTMINNDDGTLFDVNIPAFSLDMPDMARSYH